MAIAVDDYVFKLGWDGSSVTKGLDALENRLAKLSKGVSSSAKAEAKISSAKAKGSSGKITHSKYNAQKVLRDKQKAAADLVKAQQKEATKLAKQEADSEYQKLKAQSDQIKHYQQRMEASHKERLRFEKQKRKELNDVERRRLADAQLNADRMRILDQAGGSLSKLDAFRVSSSSLKGSRGEAVRQGIDQARTPLMAFSEKWGGAGAVKTKADLAKMREELSKINMETRSLVSNARQVAGQFSIVQNVTKRIGATFLAMGASAFGAYALVNTASAAYDAAKQYQKLDVAMTAAFGSQKEATAEMAYAESVAKKFALDIFAVGEGWSKISYAAKQSNMPMADARQMFEDLAVSSRAFGLSADDTKGAMRAVIQMLGKGKVNAEDLRQQLAERIPAAIPMLAKSMGITIGELEDQMKAGAIPAEKLVGMFRMMAEDVSSSGALAKSMQTLESGQQLLANSLKKAGKSFFASGLDAAIGGVFTRISKYIEKNESLIKGIGGTIAAVVNMVSAVLEPFFATFIQPIVFGLGKIYELFDEVSNIDLFAATDMDVITGALRVITGMIYDAYYGWLLIQQVIDSISLQGVKNQTETLLGAWTNFIGKIAGQDYFDQETGTQQQGYLTSVGLQNGLLPALANLGQAGYQGATQVINNITVNGNGDSFLTDTFNNLSNLVMTGSMSPVTE